MSHKPANSSPEQANVFDRRLRVVANDIHSLKGMTLQQNALAWRKSTRSGAAGHCVEVASAPTAVYVRDSKDATGPVLEFGTSGWADFLDGVRDGEFDRAG